MAGRPSCPSSSVSVAAMVCWSLAGPGVGSGAAEIQRTDHLLQSAAEVRIHIRKVVRAGSPMSGRCGAPVLLVHGGSPAGSVIFDLDVPGYSLAEDLAAAGHAAYIVDIRGWGRSTAPPSSVPSLEALEDIEAAVDWVRADARCDRIALLGHATGGHWVGMYTARHPQKVSRLVMVNSMYGVAAPWPLAAGFEDPRAPGRFDESAGMYRFADAGGLLGGWDRSIPADDKTLWRDARVAEAYVAQGLASDPTSSSRTPPSVRIPGAFRREHYEMARGRKFWEARDIKVPTLYVRGARDHWSRPEDLVALQRELTGAPGRFVTIPDATHFVFLDRPERGRVAFLRLVLDFLGADR